MFTLGYSLHCTCPYWDRIPILQKQGWNNKIRKQPNSVARSLHGSSFCGQSDPQYYPYPSKINSYFQVNCYGCTSSESSFARGHQAAFNGQWRMATNKIVMGHCQSNPVKKIKFQGTMQKLSCTKPICWMRFRVSIRHSTSMQTALSHRMFCVARIYETQSMHKYTILNMRYHKRYCYRKQYHLLPMSEYLEIFLHGSLKDVLFSQHGCCIPHLYCFHSLMIKCIKGFLSFKIIQTMKIWTKIHDSCQWKCT